MSIFLFGILFFELYFVSVFCDLGDVGVIAPKSQEYKIGIEKSLDVTQSSEQGEAGKKEYLAKHANEKGDIGHHDKERHQKIYADEGEIKKSHNHDDGYYATGQQGQHAERGYNYADKGSYAKGHDTKGHHNIRKLDEFQKKKEFFDEDHDQAHNEKHGGFDLGKEFKDGEFKIYGHAKKVNFKGEFGAAGKALKGGHNLEEAGHKKAQGHDQNFKDAEEFAKKGSAEFFKEFGYSEKDLH